MTRLALAALLLAACDTGGGGGGTADAPKMIDANTNKVQAVTCPATVDATVTAESTGFSYMPMSTTIPINGIVKFVMPSAHNVQPNTVSPSDPGLSVNFGETKCLKFTTAGTFSFFCGPHGFAGTVTVQ